MITVTIPFDKNRFEENATVKATVKLIDAENRIYKSILNNSNITVDEISKIIGKHRTTNIRGLNKLKEKGKKN